MIGPGLGLVDDLAHGVSGGCGYLMMTAIANDAKGECAYTGTVKLTTHARRSRRTIVVDITGKRRSRGLEARTSACRSPWTA